MTYWTILAADGSCPAMNVERDEAPDPAAWGAVSVEEQPGFIDPMIVAGRGEGEWMIDLTALEAHLLREIDEGAEAARLTVITPGSGQAMEYQESLKQAEAFLAGMEGPTHMLQADVKVGTIDPRTGQAVTTLAEAADLIIYSRLQEYGLPGAAIKEIRLAAKKAVRAANSREEMIAAAQIDWAAALS